MNLLNMFTRRTSAPQARERLQILLSHERASTGGQPDLLAKLREEILEVISRHVTVDQDKVMVKLDRGDQVSMLEVDIEIPNRTELRKVASG
ncbi:cell division topological specificity factor MinE [Chthonobacter rhizosphaerae]|uniref:cell division topological specificity factor MinE n=1 Tax=Chthonobacter rhizosphaerae TaxID=2735553 RepID=UPI0015EFA5E0|nr:cell division topological specificity factor MinE [Chthonobacter rhizosphaerae]